MRKGLFVFVVLALVLTTVPMATVGAQGPYKIALLTGALDNPYWQAMKAAAEKAGAELNVKVTTLGPAQEGGGVEQQAQMEDRIAAGDQAILLAARDAKALVTGTQMANKAKVPVIAVDTAPAGGDLASYIRTDNVAGGTLGGQWLAEKIGGKGTVLLLEGVPGIQASDERRDGAQAAFKKYPDIKVVTLAAGFETAKAQSVTEDTLTAHSDLAGVFASNDMMAIGAQTAVAARKLQDKVAIVGYDAIPAALDMVTDGRLGATVAQFPDKMGDLGVRFAVRVLQGKTVPKVVDSGTLLVTKDNVLEFQLRSKPLKAAKPYNITLLTGALDNPYWITMKDGADKAAKEYGVTVTTLGPDQDADAVRQAFIMEDRVARHDDAILLAARQAKALIPATESANKVGIPVIAVDTAPSGGKLASTIMTNNMTGGMLGGQYAADKIGGKGKVLVLEVIAGGQASDERRDGALAVLRRYPDIKVVAVLQGDGQTAKGQAATEDTLTANPDLAAIVCGNDMMAIGAQTAVAARGLTGKVVVVGFDAAPPALEMVGDGRMDATVAQFPSKMGQMGVEYAIRAIQGETLPALVDSGTMLVTKENVQLFNEGVYGK
jgi:ribose transport system substrate-binding protein